MTVRPAMPNRIIYCSPHREYEISDLFPGIVAMSSNGRAEVKSGLTRRIYFWYDHQAHGYRWEPR